MHAIEPLLGEIARSECKVNPLAPYSPLRLYSKNVPGGFNGNFECRCYIPSKFFLKAWSWGIC